MAPDKILLSANIAYIVVVALGSLGIFSLTTWVNATKDRELAKFQDDAKVQIAKAQSRATVAEARAAEANASAQQAKLALERLKAPRTITADQSEAIVDALQQFRGQNYALSSHEDSESLSFAMQISRALETAGWSRVPQQFGLIERPLGNTTVGMHSGTMGVMVIIGEDNVEAGPALAALADTLNSLGIVCAKASSSDLEGKTPKAITVLVGQKRID